MADLRKSRAGEVVATSTTEFEAQAVELHRAPPLGALVGVHLDDGCRVYGVVAGAYTEGLDVGARPVPRATEERQNADVYRDNPDLEHVLRTCFRCVVVGFHDGRQIRHYLPAAPAPIHYSVVKCAQDEIGSFTENFGYFPLLLNARDLPIEEVLAAHVRFVAESQPGSTAMGASNGLPRAFAALFSQLTTLARMSITRCIPGRGAGPRPGPHVHRPGASGPPSRCSWR